MQLEITDRIVRSTTYDTGCAFMCVKCVCSSVCRLVYTCACVHTHRRRCSGASSRGAFPAERLGCAHTHTSARKYCVHIHMYTRIRTDLIHTHAHMHIYTQGRSGGAASRGASHRHTHTHTHIMHTYVCLCLCLCLCLSVCLCVCIRHTHP
jgi:hypothetical protein